MSLTLKEKKCPICGYEYAIHDDESHATTCLGCGIQFMDKQDIKSSLIISYINQELTAPIKEIVNEEFSKRNIPITFANSLIIGGTLATIYISYAIFGADKSMFTPDFIRSIMLPTRDQLFKITMTNCDAVVDKYMDDVIDIFHNVIIPSEKLKEVIRDKHLNIIAARFVEINNDQS